MLNVFSIINAEKPSKELDGLKECSGALYNRVLFEGPEYENLSLLKPRFLPILVWVNKKILYQLPYIQQKTLGVRLRIATGMINKLVDEGVIPKLVGIEYHTRLVERVKLIYAAIMVEDLPF